jgi:hypothetical protein
VDRDDIVNLVRCPHDKGETVCRIRRASGSGLAFVMFLSFLFCIGSDPAFGAGGTDSNGTKKNSLGACVGVPQTFALTYERIVSPRLSTRLHAGTAVLLSSAGARIQWGHNGNGFHSYVFAGAALVHSVAEGYGDPEGTTWYMWVGPGINLRRDRWTFYTEASALLGGDEDAGLGDDWIFPFSPAITAGILAHF